jgi:subtilase family serine protease
LPSSLTGAGRTVAIVDAFDDPNAEADLATYRAQYGLPPCTTANGCFKKLNQAGVAGSYPPANAGWAVEVSLDLDAVSAVCPLCHITLVEANDASANNLSLAQDTAAAQNPVAISDSFGGSEFVGQQSFESHFSHPGIMTTVSTGDSGLGTSWPAVAPSVVAVGGTELTADSSTRGWAETVWSGAGSGCSSVDPKPAWQHDAACANRTIADVSALAGAPGATIYLSYGVVPGFYSVGGTSLAAPIIAGVYALAYPDSPIATTYGNPAALFDITAGSNGSCGGGYLCTGKVGYDGPTGLGTPCGTAAFGTGPFTGSNCPAPSASAAAKAAANPPSAVFTPVCGPPRPGHLRCFAEMIQER